MQMPEPNGTAVKPVVRALYRTDNTHHSTPPAAPLSLSISCLLALGSQKHARTQRARLI